MSWIRFDFVPAAVKAKKRKTMVWDVRTIVGGKLLGRVAWRSTWRKYAFYPAAGLETCFEEDCLRELAAFLVERTREYRGGKTILHEQLVPPASVRDPEPDTAASLATPPA